MSKKITLKLTSGIALHGKVHSRNAVVTVDEKLAKNLLHRRKAVLYTAEKTGTLHGVVGDDGKLTELSEMTVAELRDIAKELDIENHRDLKKAELVTAIQEKQVALDEDEVTD